LAKEPEPNELNDYSQKIVTWLKTNHQGAMHEIRDGAKLDPGEHSSRLHSALGRLVDQKVLESAKKEGIRLYWASGFTPKWPEKPAKADVACPKCNTANPPTAEFCKECGEAMKRARKAKPPAKKKGKSKK